MDIRFAPVGHLGPISILIGVPDGWWLHILTVPSLIVNEAKFQLSSAPFLEPDDEHTHKHVHGR